MSRTKQIAPAEFSGSVVMQKQAGFITNGDADLTVTAALHAGKVVYQTGVTTDRTYTLPTPSEGIYFHFIGVGTGAAADDADIILRSTNDTVFLEGMVTHISTEEPPEIVGVWGNGTDHDQFKINVPAGYDIHLVGKSATVYYIYGTVTSAVVPAFADA